MSKKFFAVTMAMALMVSTATISSAAKVECTVKSVSGNTVTLDCTKAKSLKEGSKVTVKEAKKKAVEGC